MTERAPAGARGPAAADDSARQYIGRYRVLEPIGVGSSAAVYRALDEDGGLEVAVKVLADNYSLVPEMRQRFLDEIALLMAINHPSVAKVYGQGQTDSGQPFLVLELADRGDLGRRVEQLWASARQPERDDILTLATQLAGALSALHQAGIVHRDVSPGNVLVCAYRSRGMVPPSVGLLQPDERYLLADLGFAKDLQLASGLTAGGGTRGFAAPEQLEEVSIVDHRADVFGATALVGWMAGPELGSRLDRFLNTGMASDPADRYQSMSAWLDALHVALDRRAVAGEEVGQIDDSSPALLEQSPPSGSPSRRMRTVVLAGLGLLIVAGVAAVLTVNRPAGDGADDRVSAVDSSLAAPSTAGPSAAIVRAEDPPAAGPSTGEAEGRATSSTSTASSSGASVSSASTTGVTGSTAATTSATTTSATTTSVTTSASSTVVETTSGTDTTEPASTTTDQRFEFSPRAFIDSPTAEAAVSGDLTVTGTARYRDGVIGATLVIRREQDLLYWHDDTQSFEPEWIRFPITVAPSGESEVTWSYTVDSDRLEPGRYFVRVWAVGSDANDPISDQRSITVLD